MISNTWQELFQQPADIVGFVLFILVFPVYHGIYPWFAARAPHGTAKGRMDLMRRSWISGLVERRDLGSAAQQTRNLTMMNSLLGSASLILLGMTVNLLLRYSEVTEVSHPRSWDLHPEAVSFKLYLLIFVFAAAFSYYMAALRRLGQFILVIGADPNVIESEEGPPVDYLTNLINKASNRYTLGVRSFFGAFPLFAWLFNSWLFVALTLFLAIKFVSFQDFRRVLGGKPK